MSAEGGPSGMVRRVVRASTAPVRGYINNHFELVKQEVRASTSSPPTQGSVVSSERFDQIDARLDVLSNAVAEQSQHAARVLSRLDDSVSVLSERVDDLERVVRQLVDVVSASNEPRSSGS